MEVKLNEKQMKAELLKEGNAATITSCIYHLYFKQQRQGKNAAAHAAKPLSLVVGNRAVSPSSTWSRGKDGSVLRAAQNLPSTFRRTQTSAGQGKFISSALKALCVPFPTPCSRLCYLQE